MPGYLEVYHSAMESRYFEAGSDGGDLRLLGMVGAGRPEAEPQP